jgi:hypothetical protein
MSLGYDRRAYRRSEILAQVQVSRESEVHIMSAQISRGGMFVHGEPTEYPDLRVGTEVEVVVFDVVRPGSDDVSLDAKVVRIEEGLADKHGFGLQFEGLSHYEVGALQTLLDRLGGAKA